MKDLFCENELKSFLEKKTKLISLNKGTSRPNPFYVDRDELQIHNCLDN